MANTLEIVSTVYDDGCIQTSYRFGNYSFYRGIIVPIALRSKFNPRNAIVAKLQQYIALADAVYCYNLEYFDEIVVPFKLEQYEKLYFEDVLFKGLAEFRYTNGIDINRQVTITETPETTEGTSQPGDMGASDIQIDSRRALVLNGGGKDGVVACELAKQLSLDLAWFSLTGRDMRRKVARVSGLSEYIEIERIESNITAIPRKYDGHKPMSLFVALVASLAAYLSGSRYIIAANEYSANFPNVVIDGQPINHQYTKSEENEVAFARLFEQAGIPVRYFSITRPLYELQIMKIFAKQTKYHKEFLSCNEGIKEGVWCLKCAKCAFVVGALYAFNPTSAQSVWGPKDGVYQAGGPLIDETIELINPDVKPFECIGTTEENRLLLQLVLKDVTLSNSQKQKYESYLRATTNRADIKLDVLSDSNNFPVEIREQLLELLNHELSRAS